MRLIAYQQACLLLWVIGSGLSFQISICNSLKKEKNRIILNKRK